MAVRAIKSMMSSRGSKTRDADPKKRRQVIANTPDDEASQRESTSAPADTTKERATRVMLEEALTSHFLFEQLEPEDFAHIVDVMGRVEVPEGQDIITQGDQGTEFFVLDSGTCDIVVNGAKVGEYAPGAGFGELALMYNATRAATILATSDCVLWSLGFRVFRRILTHTASAKMVERCEFLKNVPLLQPLTNEQITKMAGALQEAEYPASTYVIRQGEDGDRFFIIKEGSVRCTHRKSDTDDTETDLITLNTGDYFGEMALMLDEPRHANVVSVTDIKCLTLDRNQFIDLLGPLSDVLSRQMRIRILRSVPLLEDLRDDELDTIANAMRVQVFEDREYIIREGEQGTRFYIINEGVVTCTKNEDGGTERELITLSNQEYFGERALLLNHSRAANVVAKGRVECLVLEREDFNALLGDLNHIMEREVKRREDHARASEAKTEPVAARPTDARVVRPRRELDASMLFEDLRQLRTIGTGTFGRVKLVQHVPTGRVMALKCMQKAQIVSSHQERNIMNEKAILAECVHPFILELIQTYNHPHQLFMLMECVQGGELWSYIYEKFDAVPRSALGGFSMAAARFYAACVVSAFEFVHSLGVAYRDLKPENLLLDHQGFLKLIDFGFAKRIPYKKGKTKQNKSYTLCGTPEYLAPELVLSKGHDKSVDYWALGCLIYELIVGRTPFQNDHQPEIFKAIVRSDQSLRFPRGFDPTASDIVRRLLSHNPAFRLGNLKNGVADIKNHRWFIDSSTFSWEALMAKELAAPFVPAIRSPTDAQHFDQYAEDDYVARYTGPQHLFESF